MFVCLLLCVVYTLVASNVGHCSKESDEYYYKIQKLYQQTAPDNMGCWFHWHESTKKACYEEKEKKKHELLKVVQEAWHDKHYIKPIDECQGGYAKFEIGLFNGPVLLPCNEHAFDPPKHTDKEIDDMNYKLKKLWNMYNAMCLQPLSSVNCEEQKWNRGQELAKALQKAETEDYIPKNCKSDGIGAYSFNQGMDPTDMPCKPMPEGTKYGDPGTIRKS